MNPDFTLIWPLSCPKDGDHFYHPLARPPRRTTAKVSTMTIRFVSHLAYWGSSGSHRFWTPLSHPV